MSFAGADQPRQVEGLQPTGGVSNYYLGNEPELWREGVPHYRKVALRSGYPGIDVVYRGSEGRLEFDFVVAPGANPAQIELSFSGAGSIRLTEGGELLVEVAGGHLRLGRPDVFQETAGEQIEVASGFRLQTDGTVGFELASYREDLPLLIDPVVEFATLLGGAGDDLLGGVAVDAAGNVYTAGSTTSFSFPLRNALDPDLDLFTDVTITKLMPDGSGLFYSTYFGGSHREAAHDIVVDDDGNAYIAGMYEPTGAGLDFPVTEGAFSTTPSGAADGFVTKLNSIGGALVYSTLLGGPRTDEIYAIRLNDQRCAVLLGETGGIFPTTVTAADPIFNGGGTDAFLAKLSADGSEILYATYLGGSGRERVRSMALDGEGFAYVAGVTDSRNIQTTPGALQPERAGDQDVFIIKIDTTGAPPAYATYLGGNQAEEEAAIAIDSGGNAYLTGSTQGFDFPTTLGALSTEVAGPKDAFVAKLNATGETLLYSTFLGGSDIDTGSAIAVDAEGSIHVIGSTRSFDFPVTPSAEDPTYAGAFDVFVVKLSSSGDRLLYSSYFGGSDDLRVSPNGLVLDSRERVVIGGILDFLGGDDFPSTANAFQRARPRGKIAGFIAKFDLTEFGGVPQIAAGGILGAGLSVPPVQAISPNGIFSIFGNGFAPDGFFVQVSGADLVDGRVPTRLGGVCVEINGERSRVFTVTRRQLNVQATSPLPPGEATVQVVVNCDTPGEERGNLAIVEAAPAGPEFFYFDLRPDGVNPVAAINAITGELIGPAGLLEKAVTVPAKPGDTVAIFGTGFGLTTPLFEAGELPNRPGAVTLPARVTIGGVEVTPGRLLYVGVSGGNAGLYQVNLTISNIVPEGDQPVVLRIGDYVSPARGFLRIEH